MSAPYLLESDLPELFPPIHLALSDPNGLLAVGGDLSAERLMQAYRQGIFPWYESDQPILWWSPDPRMVLIPDRVKVSRSLRKRIRKGGFSIRLNGAFKQVIEACAAPRDGSSSTWITPEMMIAYQRLHHQGQAHSIEVWCDNTLCGGLYGIAIGRAFFGESMFSQIIDGSKLALVALCRLLEQWQFTLIDCQIENPHLVSMGAELIPRSDFLDILNLSCTSEPVSVNWQQTLSAEMLEALI